jgi:hypothetical protein
MRFFTSLFSALAGVFRRGETPAPADIDPSASATIELTSEDLELMTTSND